MAVTLIKTVQSIKTKTLKEYHISVSSPFDFDSPDGQNIIKGSLVKVIDNECVIFRANHPIDLQDIVGDVLILLSRYRDYNFNNSIQEIGCWPATVHIFKGNSYGNMDKTTLIKNSKYVILGTLKHEKN